MKVNYLISQESIKVYRNDDVLCQYLIFVHVLLSIYYKRNIANAICLSVKANNCKSRLENIF